VVTGAGTVRKRSRRGNADGASAQARGHWRRWRRRARRARGVERMGDGRARVVLLNGSLRGAGGNTGALLSVAARRLEPVAEVDTIELAGPMPALEELEARLSAADALLVGTGVYWHGWGSPLQRLLEVVTPHENTAMFFGKPVAVAVTMDSVGGAELAARLAGSFHALGCLIPPCSTLILSRVAVEAAEASAGGEHDPNDDVWQLRDLDVVLHNLMEGSRFGAQRWRPWPVRALHAARGPYPASGPLDLGSPRFLRADEP
jgi:NAD(P)H-dependent FMN reductase